MTDEQWQALVKRLIGKPFRLGARGPDEYDCWGLVEAVFLARGLPSPGDWQAGALTSPMICKIMGTELETGPWIRVETSEPGDMLAMSTGKRFHHVAPVTPLGILHTDHRQGAICVSQVRLRRMGYQRIEAYRWAP